MVELEDRTMSWIRHHHAALADLRKELVSTDRAATGRFRERLDLAIRQLRYASALHRHKALFVASNAWLGRLSGAHEEEGAWRDEDWLLWLDEIVRFVESREAAQAGGDGEWTSGERKAPQEETKRLPKVLIIGSQRLFDLLNGSDASRGEPGYVIDHADWDEWETAVHQELIVDRQTAILLHARHEGDLSDAVRRIRETDAFAHLPVAVVAEDLEPQQLVGLYESPADMVLAGPVDPGIVHAAIRKLMNGQAKGSFGTLTEERAQLVRLVAKEWQRYIRFQSPFALVYVSLEIYPYLLQRYGARQVNEFVFRMYELSRRSIRTSDEIRRWKSNAFVLLLPMANKEGGQLVAQRVLQQFARELGTSPLFAHVRIGVTEGERGYERAEDILLRMERHVATDALPGTLYVAPAFSNREEQAERVKVLIVDDDMVTPVLLQNHLNRSEWDVLICTDSGRALEEAIRFRPQIILSDIQLDGNNGFSFCLQCRQMFSRREAVFIFLSHQNTTSNIVRCLQVGADDFIAKPFSAAEVEARMRMHWSLRAGLRDGLSAGTGTKTNDAGKDGEATA